MEITSRTWVDRGRFVFGVNGFMAPAARSVKKKRKFNPALFSHHPLGVGLAPIHHFQAFHWARGT